MATSTLNSATPSTPSARPAATQEEVKVPKGKSKSKVDLPVPTPAPIPDDGPVTPVGPQPKSFFELLEAAVTQAKIEQGKGPEFQAYLASSGIKTAWVRAVVALYEEGMKPDDPLTYMLRLMGLGIPDANEVTAIQEKVKELREKFLELQAENDCLQAAVKEAEEIKKKDDESADEAPFISPYNSDEETSCWPEKSSIRIR